MIGTERCYIQLTELPLHSDWSGVRPQHWKSKFPEEDCAQWREPSPRTAWINWLHLREIEQQKLDRQWP